MKNYIRWTIYRFRVCYWLVRLTGMPLTSVWKYSSNFGDFYCEDGSNDAKYDVLEEMTYWGD